MAPHLRQLSSPTKQVPNLDPRALDYPLSYTFQCFLQDRVGNLCSRVPMMQVSLTHFIIMKYIHFDNAYLLKLGLIPGNSGHKMDNTLDRVSMHCIMHCNTGEVHRPLLGQGQKDQKGHLIKS